MALIVSILSTLILGIGVVGLVSPSGMRSLVSRFRSKTGFLTAIALRLVLGVALWRAAPASRTPPVLLALGVMSMVSALALTLLGVQRFEAILSWWSRQPAAFVRVSSAATIAMGAFILWSVS